MFCIFFKVTGGLGGLKKGANMLLRIIASWLYAAASVGLPGGAEVKNLPGSAGRVRDAGSIPESGRSPGGGNGNPLQYSCLEKPMDGGA